MRLRGCCCSALRGGAEGIATARPLGRGFHETGVNLLAHPHSDHLGADNVSRCTSLRRLRPEGLGSVLP